MNRLAGIEEEEKSQTSIVRFVEELEDNLDRQFETGLAEVDITFTPQQTGNQQQRRTVITPEEDC